MGHLLGKSRKNLSGWIFLLGTFVVFGGLAFILYRFIGVRKVLQKRTVASCQLPDLESVAAFIEKKYVYPSVIDVRKMAIDGLNEMTFLAPQVSITQESKNTSWVIHFLNAKKQIELPQKSDLNGLVDVVQNSYEFVCTQLKELNPDFDADAESDLQTKMINAMLATLDPHSHFSDIEDTKSRNETRNGLFAGIGTGLFQSSNQSVIITTLHEKSAAKEAGLEVGDQIVAVNDIQSRDLTLDEIVKKIRGKEGTLVELDVRKRDGKIKHYLIKRRENLLFPYEFLLLPINGRMIAYIKLRVFDEASVTELQKKLSEQEHVDGYLLDLRGNPGGLLSRAVSFADQFLSDGKIVSVISSKQEEVVRAHPQMLPPLPMVVLVNEASASASELVSGTLKQRGRALVFGRPSFGKSTVQGVFDLPTGRQLQLTIGEYLVGAKQSIQGIGVVPDVQLTPVALYNEKSSQTVFAASLPSSGTEAKMPNVLQSPHTVKETPRYELRYYQKEPMPLSDDDDTDFGIKQNSIFDKTNPMDKIDQEVKIARDYLASLPKGVSAKDSMVNHLGQFVEQQRTGEEKEASSHLLSYGVNWSCPANKQNHLNKLDPTVQLTSYKVNAGGVVQGKIKVSNPYNQSVCQVIAQISFPGLSSVEQKELYFGYLGPKEALEKKFSFKVSPYSIDKVAVFDVKIMNGDRSIIGDMQGVVQINAIASVNFQYRYQWIKQEGDKQALIQPGDTVALRLFLKNLSKEARQGLVFVLHSDDQVDLIKNRWLVDPEKKSSEDTFDFVLKIPSDYSQDNLLLTLIGYNEKKGFSTKSHLEIPLFSGYEAKSTSKKSFVTLPEGGVIYRVPGDKFLALGKVLKERCFPVGTVLDNMLGLTFSDGSWGFIEKNRVAIHSGECLGSLDNFEVYYENIYEPMSVDSPSGLIEDQPFTTIHSHIDSKKSVLGAYVTVFEAGSGSRKTKLPYISQRRSSSMDFSQKIPLYPGLNMVKVTYVLATPLGGISYSSDTISILRHPNAVAFKAALQ